MIPFLVAVLTMLVLLSFLPPRQELIHWLKPLDICISISKFDVDDGVSLYVP